MHKYSEDNQILPLDIKKQQYIDYYTSKGVRINKIKFGLFRLKNGLYYEGIIATDTLYPDENIINVPRGLLVTTK